MHLQSVHSRRDGNDRCWYVTASSLALLRERKARGAPMTFQSCHLTPGTVFQDQLLHDIRTGMDAQTQTGLPREKVRHFVNPLLHAGILLVSANRFQPENGHMRRLQRSPRSMCEELLGKGARVIFPQRQYDKRGDVTRVFCRGVPSVPTDE